MPQNDNTDNQAKIKEIEKRTIRFTSLSYQEMQAFLEQNRGKAEKERDKFLDAWLAAPIRYNIK